MLFRELRRNDRAVRNLWAADLLRAYRERGENACDIALELPTGAGKTLVGLLIAEFRRRTLGHRTIYLCPTVQLARQPPAKAAGYGIPAVALVRRQAKWDRSEVIAYQRANAIAITTYSGIFNTNPVLDDGQTLVLDDAHAGEEPVASLWSISAEAGDPRFDALFGTVRDVLPPHLARLIADRDNDPYRDPSVAAGLVARARTADRPIPPSWCRESDSRDATCARTSPAALTAASGPR